MQLFPETWPMKFISLELLGYFTNKTTGIQYVMFIIENFMKHIQVVQLRLIYSYVVSVALDDNFVFKYGIKRTGLSDNGSQFSSKMFQGMYHIIEIEKLYTSMYCPHIKGKTEHFNRKIVYILFR